MCASAEIIKAILTTICSTALNQSNRPIRLVPSSKNVKSARPRTLRKRAVKQAARLIAGRGSYALTKPAKPHPRGGFNIKGLLGKIPRGIGRAALEPLGLGDYGEQLGAGLSRWLGLGRYRVRGRGAYGVPWTADGAGGAVTVGAAPKFHPDPTGDGIVMEMSEFFSSVRSSRDYTVERYQFNPGLREVLPWGSQIAKGFQNYQFIRAFLTFKSLMTNAVANYESLGNVMICAKPNAIAAAPASQVEFEGTEFATIVRANVDATAPIECDPREGSGTVKLVRQNAVPAGASINDYDTGRIFIATSGCPENGVVLGRVYITYVVRLYNPVLLTENRGQAHYVIEGMSSGNPLGVTQLKKSDSLSLEFKQPNAGPFNEIVIPAGASGTYILMLVTIGTAGSGTMSYAAPTLTNAAFGGFRWMMGGGGGSTNFVYPATANARVVTAWTFTIMESTSSTSIYFDEGPANFPSDSSTDFTLIPITSDESVSATSPVDPTNIRRMFESWATERYGAAAPAAAVASEAEIRERQHLAAEYEAKEGSSAARPTAMVGEDRRTSLTALNPTPFQGAAPRTGGR